MAYDYSDEQDERRGIGDNLMKQLEALADRQESLESEVEQLEELLEKKKNELKIIADQEFPSLLSGLTGSLRLSDGRTVELNEKIRASIAGSKAGPACEWLDEHGHGELVKREFVIKFNRDDEAWAKKFQRDLDKRKKPLAYNVKRTVHPQTLQAWVKEQLQAGVDLPRETFGVYVQKTAKVKRPE